MKSLSNHILVLNAQIAALRFLRSGAASAELAQIAVARERDLMEELEKLREQEKSQGELTLHQDAA